LLFARFKIGLSVWLSKGLARPDSCRLFRERFGRRDELPVLVVAQNRLGCLNHTALTVRSIVKHGLPCAGVVLNELPGATNADILREIMDVPLLPGLLEEMNELPPVWRRMIDFV
jgi:dethiobiotin synthetase